MSDNVSVLKGSTSSDATSTPWWEESLFGDWCCGEPLTTQHLVVDFTPSEEQDTEFVQQKCCDFWNLVENSPELQGFRVMPESIRHTKGYHHYESSSQATKSSSSSTDSQTCERTALSVLEFAEEKGVVENAFEARLPVSCSFTSREYHENEPTAEANTTAAPRNKPDCKCDLKCKSCLHRQPKGGIPQSRPEAKRLNKTLQDWDMDHPKSMEAPGRTPLLSHSLMQRNLIA